MAILLRRARQAFQGAEGEVQHDSDDDKVEITKIEITIYMDKAEVDRLLAESDTVPTKGELDALKSRLGIEKGSLQLKSGAIYHITYDTGVRKHRWKRLGSYEELRNQVLSNG